MNLATSTTATTATTTSTTTTTPASTPSTTASSGRILLGGVIDKQSIQVEGIGKDEITDVVSANGKVVKVGGILALDSHFDSLEVRVHGNVNTSHSTVHDSAVLQLDRDGLVVELHEETNELHLERI
mmetsp:Transcript_21417/g.50356  ORF Transcript_21417/g.50356 Transcript_21417/m.50356 type:complete len:127 (+) Transcript_21417:166-546(+)